MSEEKLPMDEEQICVEYRTAAKPSAQIKILAELNDTTPERIVEILESHGVKVDKRGLRLRGPSAAPQDDKKGPRDDAGNEETSSVDPRQLPRARGSHEEDEPWRALDPEIYVAALATITVLTDDLPRDDDGAWSFRERVLGVLAMLKALEVRE